MAMMQIKLHYENMFFHSAKAMRQERKCDGEIPEKKNKKI